MGDFHRIPTLPQVHRDEDALHLIHNVCRILIGKCVAYIRTYQ